MRDTNTGNGQSRAGAEQSAGVGNSTMFGLDQFAAMNGQGMQAFVQAGTNWLKAIETVQREMLSFAQNRFSESLARSQTLAKCTSVEELVNLQTEFVRSTVDSYIQETQKLTSLCTSLAQQGIPGAPSETKGSD